jgi:hypothetical protein
MTDNEDLIRERVAFAEMKGADVLRELDLVNRVAALMAERDAALAQVAALVDAVEQTDLGHFGGCSDQWEDGCECGALQLAIVARDTAAAAEAHNARIAERAVAEAAKKVKTMPGVWHPLWDVDMVIGVGSIDATKTTLVSRAAVLALLAPKEPTE